MMMKKILFILLIGLVSAENTLIFENIGGGLWNVVCSSDADVGGFQFNVEGAAITDASGGAASEA
ncbi:uncharacterized protein METZ01_LOCUS508220, partial [marine metagenome]